ncbi:flagellar basal-body rod protein FlgF [Vibrio cincinnatiensis]|jgi:flagellar basal-body rod protein FlgF|uniref:Flagellar basal-body rod protein FlgF n=1 Tax=Vibrio cincinnatiensis DSM 19608 TaxID=1123491 RepID=A0A1T4MLF0_VIBCI|nr:flagellar basal-body rod protein FlgF [Vibrio cincinnatiensis]MCG3722693.1 flagellar basal-body rod protein FlgF [Vibrio cincinnatiensis]MCG3732685.1 flagellar basal-body rod protein FlgF [Vibrio cincinnatiensis]MCG3736108.1 flagellar basal-body rod protein FlgF [Vibrio cincinnatiensis]MCG3738580.1 flagellar basal-body rod protein FlgF [Vibrio cincinnatiensis]MCG3744687.1 flagellar basal-body rod protein FlgF [Vibrio cincinnatiensis]
MDRALFLAMSGAKQNMQAMQLRANNLANVSTTGFRADLEQARSMQAYGEGLPSRVFSMTERPGNRFDQGSVITTGRDLDITIQGDGWISVLDKTGKEGLTRNGNLRIDENGLLLNGNGHLVLGETGAPITLPIPLNKVEIGNDGTISVRPQGAPAEAMEIVDRIKLVRPDNQSLFKDINGLFRSKDANTEYEAEASVKILTGALEGSNVNAVGEMTSLIDLQRQFEMQVKMMSTAEEMDKSSDSLLRMS